jgi:hypothetical protein
VTIYEAPPTFNAKCCNRRRLDCHLADAGIENVNMAKGCAVVCCSNTYYNVKTKKPLSFFRFPRDPQMFFVVVVVVLHTMITLSLRVYKVICPNAAHCRRFRLHRPTHGPLHNITWTSTSAVQFSRGVQGEADPSILR